MELMGQLDSDDFFEGESRSDQQGAPFAGAQVKKNIVLMIDREGFQQASEDIGYCGTVLNSVNSQTIFNIVIPLVFYTDWVC
jgi:hypothetical protein